MKLNLSLVVALGMALSFSAARAVDAVPHLEMEMESSQYSALLAKQNARGGARNSKVQASLDMGKRFLAWLTFINDARPAAQKISLTNPTNTVAYPVDKPNRSNPDLIQARFNELRDTVPQWMKEIAFDGKPFIKDLPDSDEVFIKYGFELDRNYQSASRWTLQEPSLWAYAMRKSDDVRGYYFFANLSDVESKWQNWTSLSDSERAAMTTALIQLCGISNTDSRCKSAVSSAKSDGSKLGSLYSDWLPAGKAKWNSFFDMSNLRRDVNWSAANLMELPFHDLDEAHVKSFLVDNIEEEWKWDGWNLRLKFTPDALSNVQFEAGSTPHVNGIGGNTITMDANAPLSEYGVQWTIRHEFGHVLGFPDCYVEFYDSAEKVMINYQLDVSNLMCSRRGKLQAKHYEQLKAAYFQN